MVTRTLLAFVLLASFSLAQELKLVERQSGDDESVTLTIYARERKIRVESDADRWYAGRDTDDPAILGAGMYTITDCAAGEQIRVDPKRREFSRHKLNAFPSEAELRAEIEAMLKREVNRVEPHVTVLEAVKDTGERKRLFGIEARRFIFERQRLPHKSRLLPATHMRIDAWLAELPVERGCASAVQRQLREDLEELRWSPRGSKRGVSPRFRSVELRRTGDSFRGYPLHASSVLDIAPSPSGGPHLQRKSSTQVLDLSFASVDPMLFNSPQGFKEVAFVGSQPEDLPRESIW